MASGSKKVVLKALFANSGIAIAKFFAAAFSGSAAMLGEAIHSVADCANQLLLLRSLSEKGRPATELHPHGQARSAYFYALVVGILIFTLGGVYSLVGGYNRLFDDTPIQNAWVPLLVLALGIALEGYALKGALDETKTERIGIGLLTWFRKTRNSEVMAVAAEDVAAVAGLSISFVFVSLAVLTGNMVFDALGMICAGMVMCVISGGVIYEAKSMITGEAAPKSLLLDFEAELVQITGYESHREMTSQSLGQSYDIHVKVEFHKDVTIGVVCQALNMFESNMKAKHPMLREIYIEPIV